MLAKVKHLKNFENFENGLSGTLQPYFLLGDHHSNLKTLKKLKEDEDNFKVFFAIHM